jgi:hypothetical protein
VLYLRWRAGTHHEAAVSDFAADFVLGGGLRRLESGLGRRERGSSGRARRRKRERWLGRWHRGPRFAAAAWWHDPITLSVYQASGYVGAATADATISHGQQFTINQLSPSPTPASLVGASGSFRIQRTGTAMTVTTTVNGQVVTAQSTEPFAEQPLDLVMWMDDTSHSGTPSAEDAAATVTKVQLSGGGGSVKSDDFSCLWPRTVEPVGGEMLNRPRFLSLGCTLAERHIGCRP